MSSSGNGHTNTAALMEQHAPTQEEMHAMVAAYRDGQRRAKERLYRSLRRLIESIAATFWGKNGKWIQRRDPSIERADCIQLLWLQTFRVMNSWNEETENAVSFVPYLCVCLHRLLRAWRRTIGLIRPTETLWKTECTLRRLGLQIGAACIYDERVEAALDTAGVVEVRRRDVQYALMDRVLDRADVWSTQEDGSATIDGDWPPAQESPEASEWPELVEHVPDPASPCADTLCLQARAEVISGSRLAWDDRLQLMMALRQAALCTRREGDALWDQMWDVCMAYDLLETPMQQIVDRFQVSSGTAHRMVRIVRRAMRHQLQRRGFSVDGTALPRQPRTIEDWALRYLGMQTRACVTEMIACGKVRFQEMQLIVVLLKRHAGITSTRIVQMLTGGRRNSAFLHRVRRAAKWDVDEAALRKLCCDMQHALGDAAPPCQLGCRVA